MNNKVLQRAAPAIWKSLRATATALCLLLAITLGAFFCLGKPYFLFFATSLHRTLFTFNIEGGRRISASFSSPWKSDMNFTIVDSSHCASGKWTTDFSFKSAGAPLMTFDPIIDSSWKFYPGGLSKTHATIAFGYPGKHESFESNPLTRVTVDTWLAALALGSILLLQLPLFMRRRRVRQRRKLGLCLRCGYDLRQTPAVCPECGTAV